MLVSLRKLFPLLFEQGVFHLHFSLITENYVASPEQLLGMLSMAK